MRGTTQQSERACTYAPLTTLAHPPAHSPAEPFIHHWWLTHIQAMERFAEVSRAAEPQGLANTLWAMGRLRIMPPPAVLRLLLATSYASMYDMTPQVRWTYLFFCVCQGGQGVVGSLCPLCSCAGYGPHVHKCWQDNAADPCIGA